MYTAGVLEGAVIGALVGLVMYPVSIVIAKQKQKKGQAVGKPVFRDIFWPGSQDEALERGEYLLRELKASVHNVDRVHGVILAGSQANLRTTGATVHLLVQPHAGGFNVRIQAAPTSSPHDRGNSRAFTDRFAAAWSALGPPRRPTGPGPFVV